MENVLLKTALLLCQVFFLQGEVLIELATRSPAKTGENVMIKCSLRDFYDVTTDDDHISDRTCHIVWNRSYYTAKHGQLYHETLVNSHMMIITRTDDKWSRPIKSTVTLRSVDSTADGHYKCSVVCHNRIESASIRLIIDTDGWHFWSGDGSTAVSAALTVLIICLILGVAVCLALKPYCSKKCTAGNTSETAPSEVTESTSLDSVISDSPPRYSVVINTSHSPDASNCSIEDMTMLRRLSHTGSIDNAFLVPLTNAPPEYSAAMMDLAEKGVFFNPESLKPMPSSYNDALKFPPKT